MVARTIAARKNGSRPPTTNFKRTIPLQFKNRDSRGTSTGKVCSRVAVYGTGDIMEARRLMIALQAVFNCSYYGGFSRDGVWEALLTFDKNRCERPYLEEIEQCIEHYQPTRSVAVDVLDSVVTSSILAFVYRIRGMKSVFGTSPKHLDRRLQFYHNQQQHEQSTSVVETVTGMPFTANNMIQLHSSLQEIAHVNGVYRALIIALVNNAPEHELRSIFNQANSTAATVSPLTTEFLQNVPVSFTHGSEGDPHGGSIRIGTMEQSSVSSQRSVLQQESLTPNQLHTTSAV